MAPFETYRALATVRGEPRVYVGHADAAYGGAVGGAGGWRDAAWLRGAGDPGVEQVLLGLEEDGSVADLARSMPRRCADVVEADGGPTKY